MLETSARLLKLLSLLQTHRDWPGTELAERLGVSTRTVRRDVDRLRELGYPVDAAAGTPGYRLGAGSQLPPLLLDDDEAVAVAVGLSTAATGGVTGIEETSLRALTKLEQVMPARLRHRVTSLRAVTVPMGNEAAAVEPGTLSAIAAAARARESLRFDYRAHDGGSTTRTVEPYRLVNSGRRWYLVGWDLARADWRTYRVDRLALRTPNGPRFTARELPADDLAAYVSRGISSEPYRHQGRFLVHAPAQEVAERMPATTAAVQALDEGTCELVSGSNSLDELLLWVTLMGFAFEVTSPPELAGRARDLGELLTGAAGDGRTPGDGGDGTPRFPGCSKT
ncbi:helix-turn-helix transcriptional regulator [Streptosporangium carneum]|uniref:DNA-binding transcriptional regulator n=1 Tax=Streptosporangium carneum TaxID=47481 RepID=A0A9W6I638_9ACTN|nr:YafY family protein [Streptosporangium carneum]GLK11894.1 DNA-binding transcriptional regulator [Streptosporangium carneum]